MARWYPAAMARPRVPEAHIIDTRQGPAVDVLLRQLREAGLRPEPPERLGPPGAALSAVTAVR